MIQVLLSQQILLNRKQMSKKKKKKKKTTILGVGARVGQVTAMSSISKLVNVSHLLKLYSQSTDKTLSTVGRSSFINNYFVCA